MTTRDLAAGDSGTARLEPEMAWGRSSSNASSRFDVLWAAAGIAAVFGLIVLLQDLFGGRPSLILLTPPIVIAAARGGWRLGWAATWMAVVVGISVSLLGGGVTGASALDITVILAGGGLCSWYGDRLLRTRADSAAKTAALAIERSHLQSILNASPDAILAIDENGILVSFNRAAEQMFGYSAGEALGQNVTIVMPSPYRQEHDGYIGRYLKTGERRIVGMGRIVSGKRRDGTIFPMELAVDEVKIRDGWVFTGFIRDLTEQQEAEAKLQSAQSELTHMSRFSAMGEMASALAHELNQPLAAITNYMNGAKRILARDNVETTLLSEAVEKSAEQASRAGDIIRRLREFLARGETEKTSTLVVQLVKETAALAFVGAKEHGVEVRFELSPEIDRVFVDRIQIQQVLVNLVRNAIDALATCSRREIVVATKPSDNEMIEFAVADTGIGLPAESAGALFEPFFTTKENGMGVGLSICRTIVESHGGRIWATPNADVGSVFHFTIPRGAVDDHPDG
ncbi:MAG: sensor histidine kinase [Alphaproteobacteria bacterium]